MVEVILRDLSRAYKKPPRNSEADYLMNIAFRGVPGGQESPIIPDEPDVLDASERAEGFGVVGWRRVRRLRRVVCCFYSWSSNASPIAGALLPVAVAPSFPALTDAEF